MMGKETEKQEFDQITELMKTRDSGLTEAELVFLAKRERQRTLRKFIAILFMQLPAILAMLAQLI